MGRNLSALLAGTIFGLGLVIAEMTNPAKVLAFLDIFGHWDPSLAFVMGSALLVSAIGYRLAWRTDTPMFDTKFQVPTNRKIDAPLAIGALLFGAGWGLVGLCPGPAIAALTFGAKPILIFFGAMLAGVVLHDVLSKARRPAN